MRSNVVESWGEHMLSSPSWSVGSGLEGTIGWVGGGYDGGWLLAVDLMVSIGCLRLAGASRS